MRRPLREPEVDVKSLVRAIDGFSKVCGILAAVVVIVLILLMMYDAVLRYAFNAPTIWAFEVNTWLMGAAFVLSIGYALSHDAHVRVDLLYSETTRRHLRVVDLICFILLLPIVAWSTWGLWHYFFDAFKSSERTGTSAWNPLIWPFRFVLFLGFLAFAVQIVAEIIKRLASLAGRPLDAPAATEKNV
jgi:TRAP-type mannitol/chloroaromatic compound transport system permease small subunit